MYPFFSIFRIASTDGGAANDIQKEPFTDTAEPGAGAFPLAHPREPERSILSDDSGEGKWRRLSAFAPLASAEEALMSSLGLQSVIVESAAILQLVCGRYCYSRETPSTEIGG
jgi:hypothetical protein